MPMTNAKPATDHDLEVVRDIVRTALDAYAAEHDDEPRAGIRPSDLAENVKGWTHTTRLRDFVEGVRS